jgi:hypothetical protein
MTRKDYILIASVLRNANSTCLDVHNPSNPQAVQEMANAFACALANDNPKFNREHFLAVVYNEKSLTSRPAKSFRVHLGGKRYRKFSSLDEARTFCNNVASKTRVILAIEAVQS